MRNEKAEKLLGKIDLLVLLSFALVVLLLFNPVLLNPGQMISPAQDLLSAYSPWKYITYETFQEHHELPLWYPYIYSGTPYLGDLSVAMFYYPFNLFFQFFPPEAIFGYLYMFHVLLAGVGTYLFLRARGLGRFASWIAGISFMLSGTLMGRVFIGHMTNMFVISWVPMVFFALEMMLKKQRWPYAILLGIFLALQFHASMIQVFFYSCVAISLYLLFRLVYQYQETRRLKTLARPALLYVSAFIICILLASIHLIPALQLAQYSTRNTAKSLEFSVLGSFEPYKLIVLFIPGFFGSSVSNTDWGGGDSMEMTSYIGVLMLLLAFFSLASEKNRERRKQTLPFLVLAIFALLMAMGKYMPLYYLVFYTVPGFNLFRIPAAILFVFSFSMIVLAAHGLDRFFAGRKEDDELIRRLGKYLLILSILVLLSTAAIYAGKGVIIEKGKAVLLNSGILESKDAKPMDYYLQKFQEIHRGIMLGTLKFGLFLLASSALFLLRKRLDRKALGVLILLIVLADMLPFSMPFIYTGDSKPLLAKTDIITFLEKDTGRYRVLDTANYLPHYLSARYHLELVNGYDPFMLGYYVELTNTMVGLSGRSSATELPMHYIQNFSLETIKAKPILDLLNAKYIITDEESDLPGYKLAYSNPDYTYPYYYGGKDYINKTGPLYIYENTDALPRSFIVRKAKVLKDPSDTLSELSEGGFEPKEYVLLSSDPGAPLDNPGGYEEADITNYTPNEITVQAELSEPGYLVLSEIWYPRWKAYDNGQEVDILKADYCFRAVYLTEGNHTVTFRYN